jgi:hypothetical protein
VPRAEGVVPSHQPAARDLRCQRPCVHPVLLLLLRLHLWVGARMASDPRLALPCAPAATARAIPAVPSGRRQRRSAPHHTRGKRQSVQAGGCLPNACKRIQIPKASKRIAGPLRCGGTVATAAAAHPSGRRQSRLPLRSGKAYISLLTTPEPSPSARSKTAACARSVRAAYMKLIPRTALHATLVRLMEVGIEVGARTEGSTSSTIGVAARV